MLEVVEIAPADFFSDNRNNTSTLGFSDIDRGRNWILLFVDGVNLIVWKGLTFLPDYSTSRRSVHRATVVRAIVLDCSLGNSNIVLTCRFRTLRGCFRNAGMLVRFLSLNLCHIERHGIDFRIHLGLHYIPEIMSFIYRGVRVLSVHTYGVRRSLVCSFLNCLSVSFALQVLRPPSLFRI